MDRFATVIDSLSGLPHMVTRDDEFNGYFIPVGTTVVGNSWFVLTCLTRTTTTYQRRRRILHDPKAWPEPERFIPERFMGEGDKGDLQHLSPTEKLSSAFGYGRRFCPGRHMGDAQVWISIASILSVFDIRPALDDNGRPIEVKPKFTTLGMIW